MTTVFKLADKVAAFKDKLELWEQRVSKGVFDMFQTLAETLKDSEPDQEFSDLVSSHLRVLRQEFKRYFPSAKDPRTSKKWIRNPFSFKPGDSTLPVLKETIDRLATANGVRWYGHVLRRDDDSVLRVALNLEVTGKRKRGRPKKTWKKQVEEETEKVGLKKEDALRRDKWRDGVREIAEGMG